MPIFCYSIKRSKLGFVIYSKVTGIKKLQHHEKFAKSNVFDLCEGAEINHYQNRTDLQIATVKSY